MKSVKLCIFLLFSFYSIAFAQLDETLEVAERCAASLNVLPKDLEIIRLGSGVSNHVYLVVTPSGAQYAAKIFTKKSLQEVEEIEQHVSGLRTMGFNIPKTVSISLIEGRLPLHIAEFTSTSMATDIDLDFIATLMAQLHLKGTSLEPAPQEKYKDNAHYQSLFDLCGSWTEAKNLKEIYDGLDLSYLPSLPRGLIHGDFSYSNVLKVSDSQLALIDFEHICTSYLLTDLVRCQMFFGFDDQGNLLEDRVIRFTQKYETGRRLEPVEIQHFYTHMKLMMIDTALAMYYHIHVLGDLSLQIVERQENKTLLPDLLAKKIKSLSSKKAINLDCPNKQRPEPIIFFGLSGVGKTTIIKNMARRHPDLFYIPVFTCTRSPRQDDDPSEFEYVSVDEFLKLEKDGAFFLIMHEGSRYYGYRKSSLWCTWRHPILNCSPCGIDMATSIQACRVLVQGDWERGLKARNQLEYLIERSRINEKLAKEYYSKDWFLKAMDIIVWNDWTKSDEVIENLCLDIMHKKHGVVYESITQDAA